MHKFSLYSKFDVEINNMLEYSTEQFSFY